MHKQVRSGKEVPRCLLHTQEKYSIWNIQVLPSKFVSWLVFWAQSTTRGYIRAVTKQPSKTKNQLTRSTHGWEHSLLTVTFMIERNTGSDDLMMQLLQTL